MDLFSDRIFSSAGICTPLLSYRRKRPGLAGIIRPGADGIYTEMDGEAFPFIKK